MLYAQYVYNGNENTEMNTVRDGKRVWENAFENAEMYEHRNWKQRKWKEIIKKTRRRRGTHKHSVFYELEKKKGRPTRKSRRENDDNEKKTERKKERK